jgi:hypothetical protein
MQPALNLTEQERLCFMQALNAVAYRNENPENVWLTLLRRVGRLLEVSKADYQFRAGVPGIAEKVNQITNPRARLYFLRIIHDVHLKEVDSMFWAGTRDDSLARFKRLWIDGLLSQASAGTRDDSLARFKSFYTKLAEAIRLD